MLRHYVNVNNNKLCAHLVFLKTNVGLEQGYLREM